MPKIRLLIILFLFFIPTLTNTLTLDCPVLDLNTRRQRLRTHRYSAEKGNQQQRITTLSKIKSEFPSLNYTIEDKILFLTLILLSIETPPDNLYVIEGKKSIYKNNAEIRSKAIALIAQLDDQLALDHLIYLINK